MLNGLLDTKYIADIVTNVNIVRTFKQYTQHDIRLVHDQLSLSRKRCMLVLSSDRK